MVIALGVTLATAGAASGYGVSLAMAAGEGAVVSAGTLGAVTTAAGATVTLTATGAVIQAMTAVAITSLCATAVNSLVNHGGNVLEAAKDIVAAENVKRLAMTMITAGLVEGIFCGLDMSTVYKAPPGTQAVSTSGIEAATNFAKDMETFMGHLNREVIRDGTKNLDQ